MTIRVFLENTDNFTLVNNGVSVSSAVGGNQRVVMAAGVTGLAADSNVERFDLSGNLADYRLVAIAGVGFQIQDASGAVITTMPSLNQNTTIAFANGSAVLAQTGPNAFTLGGVAVSTTAAAVVATLNAADVSTSAAATTVVNTAGQTFTLTTGADAPGAGAPAANTNGSAGADTFNAFMDTPALLTSTLSGADIVRGNAGIDTLNVAVTTTATASLGIADISGVEVFNIRATGAYTTDVSLFAGLQTINADRGIGALTLTNVANTQKLQITGDTAVSVGTFTGTSVATATVSDLTLKGGLQTSAPGATLAGAAAVTINGGAFTSATINSSGAANVVADLDYAGTTVSSLTINADTNFALVTATGAISGFAATGTPTITVTGAGGVTLNALDAAVRVYNASASTGAQTLTVGNILQTITGGAGNDVITTAGVLVTGSVNAGAGTADRLIVANTADISATAGPRYSGFEQVRVNSGLTVDVSQLATGNAINVVQIQQAATQATAANGLTATQAAGVQILTAVAGVGSLITLGVAGANGAGQMDTVKALVTTTTATGGIQTIDLTGITLAGVENLELASTGTVAATTGAVTLTTTNAIALSSIKLTTIGNTNVITIDAANTAANMVVDASTSSGRTTLNATAYASTTGATLIGGTGADVFQGSVRADVMTGSGGRDTFDFGTAANNLSTQTTTDKITDFGLITVAVNDVSTLTTAAGVFRTSAAGGANADLIDISGTAATRATALTAPGNVAAASGVASADIKATLTDRGLIVLTGADAASINTVTKYLAVANLLSAAGAALTVGDVVVFNLAGSAYVFQEAGATDNLVQLSGVTATGVSIVGVAGTGLIGEVFVG